MAPGARPPRRAPFDDRWVDAQMRALIPRFAVFGCLATLALAPAVAPNPGRMAGIVANTTVALLVTAAAQRLRLVERFTHPQLYALLLLYGALIAVGTGLTESPHSPFVLLQLLPTVFAAMFFTGSARYTLPVALAAVEYGVVRLFVPVPLSVPYAHAAMYLLVAHFGAHIAQALRENVAANRALHRVLEVASGDPLDPTLAEIGLTAALSVVGWDTGVVVVRDGDRLPILAMTGASAELQAAYAGDPMRVGDRSLSAAVVARGEAVFVTDAAEFFGSGHVLVRDGVRSVAGVPIAYHGETIGALVVANRTARRGDRLELDRLQLVAEQLGLALGNARAHRREAQVAAEQRELNQRKDQFLANVSHELRTPATTIALAARTLRYGGSRLSAADVDYAYDTIYQKGQELTSLIESLLDEAIADSGMAKLSVASLEWGPALRRWHVAVSQQTGRPITLLLPDDPVVSQADPVKVERIVGHLLGNAAKYSEPGTPIVCRLQADDDWVELAVIDRGIGIAPEDQPRVFERFFQVDGEATRSRGGCGIGLSLVRHFVVAHGGTVDLVSALGAGTTVTVRLPRVPTLPAPRPSADTAPEARTDAPEPRSEGAPAPADR